MEQRTVWRTPMAACWCTCAPSPSWYIGRHGKDADKLALLPAEVWRTEAQPEKKVPRYRSAVESCGGYAARLKCFVEQALSRNNNSCSWFMCVCSGLASRVTKVIPWAGQRCVQVISMGDGKAVGKSQPNRRGSFVQSVMRSTLYAQVRKCSTLAKDSHLKESTWGGNDRQIPTKPATLVI